MEIINDKLKKGRLKTIFITGILIILSSFITLGLYNYIIYISINSRDSDGNTPLINAVKGGNYNEVLDLVNRGADLNITMYEKSCSKIGGECSNDICCLEYELRDTGKTALLIAVEEGEKDIVQYLLQRGTDQMIKNRDYINVLNSSLLNAVFNNNIDIVVDLLAKGANPNTIGSGNGKSVLMIAAEKGNRPMVDVLLNAGADINMKDYSSVNALFYAVLKNKNDISTKLIIKGSNVNVQSQGDIGDFNGYTPLLLAIYNKNNVLALKLLDQGALVNVYSSTGFGGSNQEDPLHLAIKNNNIEVVNAILNKYKKQTDYLPQRLILSLQLAIESKNINLVKEIASRGRGATINYVNTRDYWAPGAALGSKNIDIIKSIIDYNDQIDDCEWNHASILHRAILGGSDKNVVQLILQKGINMNKKDGAGNTALYYAQQRGDGEIIKMLIDAGAK